MTPEQGSSVPEKKWPKVTISDSGLGHYHVTHTPEGAEAVRRRRGAENVETYVPLASIRERFLVELEKGRQWAVHGTNTPGDALSESEMTNGVPVVEVAAVNAALDAVAPEGDARG